jgi:hypothetical protein
METPGLDRQRRGTGSDDSEETYRWPMRSPRVANVVAFLALFVAIGGISWAAIKLPKNSVGAAQIKKNAVRSADVKNRSLLARDFKAGQLPAGAMGAPGPQGPQGIPGAQGPAGTIAYERTIVVHPGADADAGGAALRAALASITDAGTDKKYLIFLEPGVYAIKDGPLQLKDHVNIQGSGSDVTRLLADSSVGSVAVKGAHALISDLTLHYGSTAVQDIVALEASASTFLRLVDSRVTASGGGSSTTGLRLVASSNVSLTDTEVFVSTSRSGSLLIGVDVPAGVFTASGGSMSAQSSAGTNVTVVALRSAASARVRSVFEISATVSNGSATSVLAHVLGGALVESSRISASGGTSPAAVSESGGGEVIVGASGISPGPGTGAPVCVQSYDYTDGSAVTTGCV